MAIAANSEDIYSRPLPQTSLKQQRPYTLFIDYHHVYLRPRPQASQPSRLPPRIGTLGWCQGLPTVSGSYELWRRMVWQTSYLEVTG